MHKSSNFAHANLIQLLLDIVFLMMTFWVAYNIASRLTGMNGIASYCWILIIFIPFWLTCMALSGMYNKTTFYYFDRVLRNVIYASIFAGLGLSSMFYFIKETCTSRMFIGLFIILCIVIMFSERCFWGTYFRRNISTTNAAQIIVVCSRETYLRFTKYLRKTQIRYNIIGVIQVDEGEEIPDAPSLGRLEDLGQILKTNVVDEVIFNLPNQYSPDWQKYVGICEQMGITTRIVLNINYLNKCRINASMLGTLPVLTFHTVSLNPIQQYSKRLLDIIGSLIGIFITMLISIFVIPVIKLDSPGPIIFKQKRVGRYGRIFDIYKFRTMSVDAESRKCDLECLNEHKNGLMFKIKDDPRTTKAGVFLRKTSLDEFPQFFNVLKGDMSLVGTRPPTIDEYELYDYEHMRRLSIKPGITGLWQVNGRSSIKDFDMVVALDTQYIDNWSIWMDFNIMFLTIVKVVGMNSAY